MFTDIEGSTQLWEKHTGDGIFDVFEDGDPLPCVGTADTSVTVNNVAPLASASGSIIDENGIATVRGTIMDPGSQDSFTGVIDWGEGAPEPFNYPAGSTSYSETHQYLDDNPTATLSDVFVVGVTVTDKDGGAGTADTSVTVNNVAPIVTADQTASGKLSFGFVARSTKSKGSSTFSGQTQINFRAGDLNFHSSAYDSLVFDGAKATYSGTGTINGSGEFGFVVSVIDTTLEGRGGKGGKKAQAGSAGKDKFRIRIFDNNTGAVIYDNEPSAAIEDDPTTELGGGSIEIHKR